MYVAAINIEMNADSTKNYYTVRPVLDISLGLRDGEPLARYQKEYEVFRHVTAKEALDRALLNIEQDLRGNFSAQIIRRIGE